MADPTFHRVPVRRAWREAQELLGLALDLSGTDLASSHTVPGQYVQLRVVQDDKPAFLAIASAPGESEFEFLVKLGSPLTDRLAELVPGDTLEITAAQGHGFPIAGQEGKHVLLFAVGSGISAIRSLLLYVLAHADRYGQVALFYGVKTPEHFAYQREFSDWEAKGLRFVRTISRPEGVDWSGETGYVTDYVRKVLERERFDVEHSVAFLCGTRAMVDDVKDELSRQGLAQAFTNF